MRAGAYDPLKRIPLDLTSSLSSSFPNTHQPTTTPSNHALSIAFYHIHQHHLSAFHSQPHTATMTRTHKATDRDHVGLANGTAAPEEHLPRYFGKAGHEGMNPSGTKKQGGGKGNWGQAGHSELEDYSYNPTQPKRRSNSTSQAAAFKTKFELLDPEVVEYDEDLHGPDQHELEKMSTTSSADTMGSVDEEDVKETK